MRHYAKRRLRASLSEHLPPRLVEGRDRVTRSLLLGAWSWLRPDFSRNLYSGACKSVLCVTLFAGEEPVWRVIGLGHE